ncbi:NAD(P)H-quinone oxidoreductase [Acuticoccus sediminis]|uniref:NAD(P)H-quinone oxidoreductase n=2 Tax=Acuticoccus sediminis TaxID=2184697 RepID=A0A8B2NFB6_9HYPH|nr:NAD(P)H-quinone oxidoreductase [Acuticoccus sediminis]
MQCVRAEPFGGPEVLKVLEAPRPEPGEGEVLIRVEAAGVNRPDIVQRLGNYPPPPGVTDILGLEVAGEVVAIGAAVDGFAVGDRVCALVAGGGYAQYVAAPAVQVLPIPGGLSAVEAAAIPETYFTVWANVFLLGRLAAGETLLVHGGASGIGTTAIALAAAMGARVLATVRDERKAALCRSLGAEVAIDYTTENFADRVLEATGGKGVDVVLDMRGGPFFPENLRCLAYRGRMVSIASLAGRVAELDISLMMRKQATITGSTLRARPVAEKGAIAAALREHVWPLFERGAVRPVVDRTFPLAEASEAHRLIEANKVNGKVVLELP